MVQSWGGLMCVVAFTLFTIGVSAWGGYDAGWQHGYDAGRTAERLSRAVGPEDEPPEEE